MLISSLKQCILEDWPMHCNWNTRFHHLNLEWGLLLQSVIEWEVLVQDHNLDGPRTHFFPWTQWIYSYIWNSFLWKENTSWAISSHSTNKEKTPWSRYERLRHDPILHLLYPLIYQWTPGFLPYLGYVGSTKSQSKRDP